MTRHKLVCSGCSTGWCKTDEMECVAEIVSEDTIEGLLDEYRDYLASWDNPHLTVRDGVDILDRAEKLGYELDYVGRKFDKGIEIPGHVVARKFDGSDTCY